MTFHALVFVLLAVRVAVPARPIERESEPVVAVTDSEVIRTHQAAPAVTMVQAPSEPPSWPAWWPVIAILAAIVTTAVYRGRKVGRLEIPGRTTISAPALTEADIPPMKLGVRTAEDCRTQYIETVRAQVRRMIGRSDIRCIADPRAPVEMRWRAWMGSVDYLTANPEHRATGRSEGAALKRLLATHRNFGGDWIGFAVDRDRKAPVPVLTIVTEDAA